MSPSVEPAEALTGHAPEPGEQVEMQAHKGAATTFFSGFDGLRAIAALAVLVTHVWLSSSYRGPGSTWLTQLDVGVPVFFVISGFLLYRPFVASRIAERDQQSTAVFWKRRVLRIFPAYWVALIIVSAFFYEGPLPIENAKQFITHALLLQVYTHDRPIGGPIQQSWTLAVEVAFYAFLPFYAMAIRRIRPKKWSVLTVELVGIATLYVFSCAYRIVLLGLDFSVSRYSQWRIFLPGFLDTLALGMLLAVLSAWFTREGRHVTAPRWAAGAAWATAFVCYALLAEGIGLPLIPTGPRTDVQFMVEQFLRGIFALALVFPAVFAATRPGVIHRFLSARVMVALGLVSYGIYLWHEAMIDAYLQWRDLFIFQPAMINLLVFVLITTILVATISYHAIEKPAMRLKNVRLQPAWLRRRTETWGQFEKTLLFIMFVGLVIRFAYAWFERRPNFAEVGVIGDANFYHRGAQLLADGKGFISTFSFDVYGKTIQDASHPPLYILWLSIPSLLGWSTTTAHQLWTLPIGVATVGVVGYCGKDMIGPRVGLIAAGLAAIYPNVWSHDALITSETAAIFTTTLTVWMGYRYWRVPSMKRAIGLGIAVALAVFARSEVGMLVPFMVIPLILATRDTSWKERWKRLVAAGAMMVIIVGPWVVWNLTRFEEPVTLSTGYGITLLSASCDQTYYGDAIGYWKMECALPVADKIRALEIDQSVAEKKYRAAAIEYIKDHKKRFAYVTLVRWARYTGVWDLTHDFDQVYKDINPEGREPYVAWSAQMMWFVIGPLAIAGVVVMRRRKVPVYIVCAPIFATIVTTTITFYQNRYRASAEPAFCLLAAVAIDAIVRRMERARGGTATDGETDEPRPDGPDDGDGEPARELAGSPA